MRRLAVAAAVALAACSVKLEGAPCTSDANCPDGQRCEGAGAQPGRCVDCVSDPACAADGTFCVSGDDTLLRLCSTNAGACRYSTVTACPASQTCQGSPGAAACQCPLSGSALGQGCSTPGGLACDAGSGNAIACASQGTCLVWTVAPGTTCSSQGLVCDDSSGSPVCVCNAYPGTAFYADPISGSAASSPLKPTGAQAPAACRLRSLGDALARAATASPATVYMTGWTSTSGAIAFSGAASGETFPLVVAAGVTLSTTDLPPAPGHYLVEVDQAAAGPALKLDHDAAASGFTVQPATGGSASEAILVSCAAPGTNPVALSDLVLDGKGQLVASAIGVGLRLAGPCSVSANGVTAESATGAGIRVETSFPMGGPAPTVSIASSAMRRNGDGGLVVNLDASNGKPVLTVEGNDVTLNDAATTYTDTSVVPNVARKGGGVVLLAAAPAQLAFTGNKVHGNFYDQVLIWSSDPAWTLRGSACDATSNVYACYDAVTSGGPWVGLSVLGGATVDARYDSWGYAVPQSGRDYYKTSTSTVNTNPVCAASTLTCP